MPFVSGPRATLDPGLSATWESRNWGGDMFPQSDVRPEIWAFPDVGPVEAYGVGSTLSYGDFTATLQDLGGRWTHGLTVRNRGPVALAYYVRVWWP